MLISKKKLNKLINDKALEIVTATKEVSYKEWEQDFSFLNFIISAHKSVVYKSRIDIALTKDIVNSKEVLIVDEELLQNATDEITTKTLEKLSNDYMLFLIKKYFSNNEQFVEHIGEVIYFDTLLYAQEKNIEVRRKNMLEKNRKALERQLAVDEIEEDEE